MIGNVLKILRGTVTAQALGFVALPLLARYYSPEAFGILQLFQVAMGFLLVTTSMRYEIALLRATEGRELSATLVLCGLINLAMCVLVAIGCAVAYLGPFNLASQTRALLFWLPVGVLAAGALQTLGYLALRDKAYTQIASAKVAQTLGFVVTSVGIGLLAPANTGLILGDLIGRVTSVGIIGMRQKLIGITLLGQYSLSELSAAARRFREYPLISVPGGLVNTAGGMLTSLMMFMAFDASTAGQYGLVERAIMLPMGLVAGAVSQVFTADLSDCLRDGRKRPVVLYRGVIRRMFILGLVPTVVLGLGAPTIFGLLFGSAWSEAGEFARIMSPLILVALVTTPVNMAITIAGHQRIQFVWEMFRLFLMLSAWFVIIIFDVSASWAVAVHVLIVTLCSVFYLFIADRILGSAAPIPVVYSRKMN